MKYIPKATHEEWTQRIMAIENIDMRHRIAMIIWWDCSIDGDAFWNKWYNKYSLHFKMVDDLKINDVIEHLRIVGYRNFATRVPKYRRLGRAR